MLNAFPHDQLHFVLGNLNLPFCTPEEYMIHKKIHLMKASFTNITELPALVVLTLHTGHIYEIIFNSRTQKSIV